MVRPAIFCSVFSIVMLISLSTFIVSIVIPLDIKKEIKKHYDDGDNDIPEPPVKPGPPVDPEPEPPVNPEPEPDTSQEDVEVWLIDQSDTFSSQGNGILDSG